MSSIQAYKAHKQEGTLVSKVHKQGALGTSSQASLHLVSQATPPKGEGLVKRY